MWKKIAELLLFLNISFFRSLSSSRRKTTHLVRKFIVETPRSVILTLRKSQKAKQYWLALLLKFIFSNTTFWSFFINIASQSTAIDLRTFGSEESLIFIPYPGFTIQRIWQKNRIFEDLDIQTQTSPKLPAVFFHPRSETAAFQLREPIS